MISSDSVSKQQEQKGTLNFTGVSFFGQGTSRNSINIKKNLKDKLIDSC